MKKSLLSEEDKALFRSAVRGVKPLQDNKIHHQKPRPPLKKKFSTRQGESKEIHVSSISLSQIDSNIQGDTELYYAKPHLPAKQLRAFRQGKIPSQAILDLHGKSIADAEIILQKFLVRCVKKQVRYVQIIHGKGMKNLSAKITLKQWLAEQLKQIESVLAFTSSKPRDGGTGAVYVLLKIKDCEKK